MITLKIGNDAAIELPTIIAAKRFVHHRMITTKSTVKFKIYTDNLRDLDQYIIFYIIMLLRLFGGAFFIPHMVLIHIKKILIHI